MKKTLLSLTQTALSVALALVGASASAASFLEPAKLAPGKPRVTGEYSYNEISGGGTNHVVTARAAATTKYGIVDAGVSHISVYGRRVRDDGVGFEVGYSLPLKGPAGLTITPRLGLGTYSNVDLTGVDDGTRDNSKYYKASLEVSKPLNEMLSAYASFSHSNGFGSDSFTRANRAQLGIDVAVKPNLGIRAGLSTQRFDETRQNGVVIAGTYSF